MKNSSRFFRNTSCAHFPCHPNADPETFNCLFCYCPLYFLPECIGTPRWNANGIKDCIIQKLSAAIRERAAEGKEKGPRQPTE